MLFYRIHDIRCNAYVQSLDRWYNNQTKEERIIGLSKIHHIQPNHPQIRSTRIESFKKYDCKKEEVVNIYPKVVIVKGNPYYEEAKGYSAVSRTYCKLRDNAEGSSIKGKEKGLYLCKLVLTFPKELSEYYYERNEYERAWELFKKFWERLGEELCIADEDGKIREQMGGLVNLHPWKTEKPMEPHYHIHCTFLNVVKRGEEGIRFSPKMDNGLLEWQKEKWRVILEEEGRRVFGEGYEIERTDVYYEFADIEKKGKIIHGLKYQSRQWIVDFCDWSERERYEGEIPWKMQRYRNKGRTFGYWRKLGMKKESEEEEKEMRKGEKKICPFCGGITKKIGEESPEEIWKKLERGEIEWYELRKNGMKKVKPPSKEMFRKLCTPEEKKE